jgi:two-component system nitrogen regulation sensor histidine kinase GlnL
MRSAENIGMKIKKSSAFPGLDLLSPAVVLINSQKLICYLNSAAKHLFAVSKKSYLNSTLEQLAGTSPMLGTALDNALKLKRSYICYDIAVSRPDVAPLHLDCTVTPVAADGVYLLLEFRPIDYQQQAYREFIRNLACEIKNPLCSIRVAAQMLESELDKMDNAPSLREYTQVTVKEVDRLQDLMQILLSSHRAMQLTHVSVFDTLERVRDLIQSEFSGVQVLREYDNSIPDITGEKEHLTQAIFNIARDAAQAMGGKGEIVFHASSIPPIDLAKQQSSMTADQDLINIARDAALIMKDHNAITGLPHTINRSALAKRRISPSLKLQIIQNESGIHEAARKKKGFVPDSESVADTSIGLMLARSFIQQHQGRTVTEYRRGRTYFTIRLPVDGYVAMP